MADKWGPDFWILFHLISIKYPTNPDPIDKYKICNFIQSIPDTLPCSKCSSHFKKNLDMFPLKDEDISCKNKFVTWFVDFHNIVNEFLKKKTVTKVEAQKNIDYLLTLDYMTYLKKVLYHIEVELNNRKHKYSINQYKQISNFIDSAIYFSNKKFDNLDLNITHVGKIKKLIKDISK